MIGFPDDSPPTSPGLGLMPGPVLAVLGVDLMHGRVYLSVGGTFGWYDAAGLALFARALADSITLADRYGVTAAAAPTPDPPPSAPPSAGAG